LASVKAAGFVAPGAGSFAFSARETYDPGMQQLRVSIPPRVFRKGPITKKELCAMSPRGLYYSLRVLFVTTLAGLSFIVAPGTSRAADAAPAPIALGPYVYAVTPTNAIVRWATATGSESEPIYEFHEKALTDLKPGTAYPYDVLGTGAPEGKGTVTTFPQGPAPFRFVGFGDTRTRHDVHQRIVGRIIPEKPLFVINTGDLVSDGTKASEWPPFFKINHELMRTTPYYAVLGNHEKNAKMFFDAFRQSEKQRYSSFTVGDVLFLMLDSEAPNEAAEADAHKTYMTDQKAWVEKTLNENKSVGFVIACFHKPLYSVKKSRLAETTERREFWGDLFERNGVQVVFCGHDHYYLHAAHGGCHYITSGGGGAPLYDIDANPQPDTVKAVKIEHFSVIDVALDKATFKVIDIDGHEIDRFEVAKRKTN
jgi:hypothetical protein